MNEFIRYIRNEPPQQQPAHTTRESRHKRCAHRAAHTRGALYTLCAPRATTARVAQRRRPSACIRAPPPGTAARRSRAGDAARVHTCRHASPVGTPDADGARAVAHRTSAAGGRRGGRGVATHQGKKTSERKARGALCASRRERDEPAPTPPLRPLRGHAHSAIKPRYVDLCLSACCMFSKRGSGPLEYALGTSSFEWPVCSSLLVVVYKLPFQWRPSDKRTAE